MTTQADLQAAFEQADAVLALEGMTRPEGFEQIQQAVIEGKLTFGEAVARVVAEARAEVAAASPLKPEPGPAA
jgi:hypothetical protein